MTIFYFTATGNSLAVAKAIGGTLISVPQVIDSDNLHFKEQERGVYLIEHKQIYRKAAWQPGRDIGCVLQKGLRV